MGRVALCVFVLGGDCVINTKTQTHKEQTAPFCVILRCEPKEASMAFDVNVNGTRHTVDADPQTPLLWVIRDYLGLTGTKFSCGIGQCGACTVHVYGQATRSCSVAAERAVGKK